VKSPFGKFGHGCAKNDVFDFRCPGARRSARTPATLCSTVQNFWSPNLLVNIRR